VAGELLGEAHRRLLDDLTTCLTAVRQGDLTVPRVVLLTSRPGPGGRGLFVSSIDSSKRPRRPDTLFTQNELAHLREQQQQGD